MSKAQEDPALQKLEMIVKAEFGDVIGARHAKDPPAKKRSGIAEAVINFVKDNKQFRQRNFALTGDRLEALKAIIQQFLERGWRAHSDLEWGSPAFIFPKKTKGSSDL